MEIVPVWVWVALLVLTLGGWAAEVQGVGLTYWVQRDAHRRTMIRTAARIRRTWRRTARVLQLMERDPYAPGKRAKQVRTPPIRGVSIDRFAVTLEVDTVLGVSAGDIAEKATDLANKWRAAEVEVMASAPGRVRIRATYPNAVTERFGGVSPKVRYDGGHDVSR
ncbi:hypothetical protein [Nocardia brasiliensis]|uniref:hypothetical protein n=1 Tax=Nocardia brasiliensis TaxID=37326 RepID=UPI002455D940|nr:hypothetical protein [Nocardia brasiliensis]